MKAIGEKRVSELKLGDIIQVGNATSQEFLLVMAVTMPDDSGKVRIIFDDSTKNVITKPKTKITVYENEQRAS